MPLIDLQTDLKSLKYGQDQLGGGNSGQPYITVDINRVDTGFNRLRFTKFDDGLVRGGTVGAINTSVVDTLRIGKFLTDFPKGPLFIVKQVGLQLSNPQIEHKTNFPTNRPTRGQGLIRNVSNFITNTANKILNAVGPTRIYNLGINTLAQVPVNAFGQHIVRHGFTPRRNDDNLYFRVAQHNNNEGNNRLTQLRAILGTSNDIRTYISGPSSVYGIGSTIIRRRGDFIDINRDTTQTEWATSGTFILSENNAGLALVNNERQAFTYIDPDTFNGAVSSDLGQRNRLSAWNRSKHIGGKAYLDANFEVFKDIPTDPNQIAIAVGQVSSNNDIANSKGIAALQEASASQNIKSFTALSNYSGSVLSTNRFPGLKEDTNIPLTLLNYTASNADTSTINTIGKWGGSLTASVDLGLSKLDTNIPVDINSINAGINQNAIPYTNPLIKKYSDLRAQVNKTSIIDQNFFKTDNTFTINRGATDLKYVADQLKNKFNRTNDIVVSDDTMALQFTPLDPFTGNTLSTLSFLGYLSDYSEDYNSNWGNVRYAGRAESFYIFNEFKRTVSVGFQIPCYNRDELIAKHCLLSELSSTLAGKYQNNLLGGIITRLKIGNYLNNQPGIITNLNFAPIQDSNWDLDLQLAYYLKVSFGFTVIHDYLPQYYECGFIFKDPEQDPQPAPQTTPQPTIDPAPSPQPVPVRQLPISNDTGSLIRYPIGRTDIREPIDHTYVKKPVMPVAPRPKFGGFRSPEGEGGYGGGGGGLSGRLW
jgi:hypothetical protein